MLAGLGPAEKSDFILERTGLYLKSQNKKSQKSKVNITNWPDATWKLFLFRNKSLAHSSTEIFKKVPHNYCSKSIRKFPQKASMLVFFNVQHNCLRIGWLLKQNWFKNFMEPYHRENFQVRHGQYDSTISQRILSLKLQLLDP